MFQPRYAGFVLAATVLMTLQPIVTSASKVDGRYEYLQVSATLLAELTKLFLSLAMYARLPPSARTHRMLTPRHLVPFAAPAAIYFVNNNLIFVILAYVNSTTYQILSSLKTVFTGLLFRVLLKRRLSDLQSLAIVLLACGTAISQLGGGACAAAAAESTAVGVACAVLTCLLSAFGGVYSERLMKHGAVAHSIHLQNMLLYVWGVLFNSLTLLGADGAKIWRLGLLHGYTPIVWALVLNNAFNGLAISAILKYTDNIVRVFAHAAAMMLTMALEVALFGATPTPQLLVSATVVACAVYLYNRKEPTALEAGRVAAQPQQGGGALSRGRGGDANGGGGGGDGDDGSGDGGAGRSRGEGHPGSPWPLRRGASKAELDGARDGASDDERQPLIVDGGGGGGDHGGGSPHAHLADAHGGGVGGLLQMEQGDGSGLDGPRLTRHADGYRVTYGRHE